METHDRKDTGWPRRGNRKHAQRGDSGQALPLPPRAPRAPPPPQPPHATPTRRGPGWAPPQLGIHALCPRPGLGNTSHPGPSLTCGCRLAAVRGGNLHSPLPGGSEFTTYFPTPSRGGGRASFSSVWRGGETQYHSANRPRLPLPRQSGPPLAALPTTGWGRGREGAQTELSERVGG